MREFRVIQCDDNKRFREILNVSLEKYGKDNGCLFHIDEAQDGASFLTRIEKNQYDITFLDIDLPDVNGIELAKRLREINKQTIIIFMSSFEDKVFDAFGLYAIAFIRKINLVNDLKKSLDTSLILLQKENDNINLPFEAEDGIVQIPLNEIIYLEYHKRKIVLHCNNAVYISKREMIFEKVITLFLSNSNFYLINRNCIINIKQINRVFYDGTVEMKCLEKNTKLQISRRKRQEFRNILLTYHS